MDHLLHVRQAMENMYQNGDDRLIQLVGLAGLCHDLAKSHQQWQQYIRDENIKRGPTHAACGAFFFSFWGYHLLQSDDSWEEFCINWLWLTRDIADHHSELHNLSNDQWIRRYDWDMYDLRGMKTFIQAQFPALYNISFDEEVLEDWVDDVNELVQDARDELFLAYEQWEPLILMKKLQKWRTLTTALIAGDRFDAKTTETTWIDTNAHLDYQKRIDRYCAKNQGHPLSAVRIQAQANVFQQLKQEPDQLFYALDMPTGYGKTITALKMATWFGEQQGYKKIIYVAPYLSILEQTARVIEEAMDTKVLEHHSLALLDRNDEQRVASSQLAMEAWAHSIVCTSFKQFSKALFPRRSQDVLRRAFLQDSVVIIDEPQIFQPEVWNVFLCGLEALGSLLNLKVIFLSATMPPFAYGLTRPPVTLQVTSLAENDRYTLRMVEAQDETTLSHFMYEQERQSQAVILNTIEDAFRVYKNIDAKHTYLLHGLMTPLHKKMTIERIRSALRAGDQVPLYVVSTQVIEAGVDVSFQHVARALPILPSIVQAAGRVNRHQEGGQKGLISLFPFYREGVTNTRSFIYPVDLQKITDQLIQEKEEWRESELTHLVRLYYDEMFRQNTYEGVLKRIQDAYEGEWKALSDIQPFKQHMLTLPLFVPWDPEGDHEALPSSFVTLQKEFQLKNGADVYERYRDPSYMEQLSFDERKQFMILFHYYVLNLPVKKALQVASKEDFLHHRIPILTGTDAYDSELGLKAPFEEYDNFI